MSVWWWSAIASADPWGYGDGSDGVLTVTSPATEVNTSTTLVAPTAAGATYLVLDDASGFDLRDLLLVHRTQITTPAVQPMMPSWDLGPEVAAGWDLVRVHSFLNDEIWVAPPLSGAAEAGTQVVRVPEYSAVVVQAGASLQAAARSGTQGGIVAFLSLGPVTIDGVVTASGAGSPGGVHVQAPGSLFGCTPTSTTDPAVGGQKGAGLLFHQLGATHGRAAWANAGGGGNCHNGSGGGGGALGGGGTGGASHADIQSNRAEGGLALLFSATDALPFGGGGGAGQANDTAGGDGGAGGGLVWLRAPLVTGTGTVAAAGLGGGAGGADGAGGGGGGGVIAIRSDSVLVNELDVRGGGGGSTADNNIGGGGGGGGGLVYLERPVASAIDTLVTGGPAGTDLDGELLGATAGSDGAVVENPSYDPDFDDDGLTDVEEGLVGSDPMDSDTDDDGLTDEVDPAPTDADYDDDCVPDGIDPDATVYDADGDRLPDSVELSRVDEVSYGTSDGAVFPYLGTDPSSDCDFDDDPTTQTDPLVADTDGDSVSDGLEDADHDGTVDPGETDPNVADGPMEPHSGLGHSGIHPHSSPVTGDDDDDDTTTITTEDDGGKAIADPGCGCTSAPFTPFAPALGALAALGRRSRKRR